MTNLRIFRTFKWSYKGDPFNVRFGGDNQLSLLSHDELQYEDESGYWQPVPVVEAEKPEHPKDAQEREHAEQMRKALNDIFKNSKVTTFEELLKESEKTTLEKLNMIRGCE